MNRTEPNRTELFDLTDSRPVVDKCDCKKMKKKGKEIKAPTADQPTVILSRSIDERYYVGSCHRCGKIVTKMQES